MLGVQYMIKRLPIVEPLVTAYPYHGNLLSILQANDVERTLPYILDNYVGLYISDFPHEMKMDFYVGLYWKNCPFIHYQRMDRTIINRKWASFSEFVIDYIDEGMYVYLLANHYYLPPSSWYLENYCVHDLFISGYDLNKKVCYVSDNFLNGKYSTHEVKFEDLNRAYSSLRAEDDWLYGVEAVKYRDSRVHWFDSVMIRNKLTKYINSSNLALEMRHPGEYWKTGYLFGMSVYDKLLDHITWLEQQQTNTKDIRPFHVLYEHKIVLQQLFNKLSDLGTLHSNDYKVPMDEIIQKAYLLRNHYLKFLRNNDMKLIILMKDTIVDIRKQEFAMIQQVIEHIGYFENKTNKLCTAKLHSNSICLSSHRNIEAVKDFDLNSVYRSADQPIFPVTIIIEFDDEQQINEIQLKTRFGQSFGVTQFFVQGFIDDRWVELTDLVNFEYQYNDYTIETIRQCFNGSYSFSKLKIIVTKANTSNDRFEINWIGLY